jgi:hypothetical protein
MFLSFLPVKNLKYEELRTKLRERLYADILNVFNLTCSDNEGQIVNCPNGFCQLARKGISIVDRRCIPQGNGTNPSGIIISSNSIEGPNAEATFIYACNKAMCNGAETDTQVRQLLIVYGLLPSSDDISQVITTITPTGTTTPPPGNSAMTTLHQTIMNFQWMFILIITNLLKI